MFTGIVEEIGKLKNICRGKASAVLEIACSRILEDIHIGDSICTNGICLTVTDFRSDSFSCDVMHETINRTAFKDLHVGAALNLERAMAANGRFGGHMVSGHIDGTGHIYKIQRDDNAVWFHIRTDRSICRYIIEKGSIAIDGISLTVAGVSEDTFSVSCIPHTLKETILQYKKEGSAVNLECDMVGKYIEKLAGLREARPDNKSGSGLTRAFLAENGF